METSLARQYVRMTDCTYVIRRCRQKLKTDRFLDKERERGMECVRVKRRKIENQ